MNPATDENKWPTRQSKAPSSSVDWARGQKRLADMLAWKQGKNKEKTIQYSNQLTKLLCCRPIFIRGALLLGSRPLGKSLLSHSSWDPWLASHNKYTMSYLERGPNHYGGPAPPLTPQIASVLGPQNKGGGQ